MTIKDQIKNAKTFDEGIKIVENEMTEAQRIELYNVIRVMEQYFGLTAQQAFYYQILKGTIK